MYTSLYVKRHALPEDLNVYGYLYNAVKFKLSTQLRNRNTRKRNLEHFYRINSQYTSEHAGYLYETKELEHVISSSVELLPERCRRAFVLNRYENLSYNDIASEMGVSVKTVEKHISKAMQLLRKRISGITECFLALTFLASQL